MKTNIQETIDRLHKLDQKTNPAPWDITGSRCPETMEGIGTVIEDSEGKPKGLS